jgi:sugar phosphate isomerase/epimerase
MGKRAPLLHLKDGPVSKDLPMTAVGKGKLDWKSIVAAGDGNSEWLIVELDSCATDMMEAVKDSYQYVTSEGLARGKN